MGTRPWPWTDGQQSGADKGAASSSGTRQRDGDNDDASPAGSTDEDECIPRDCSSFRRGCLSACFEAIDHTEHAVVRFMLQVDPALLNCQAQNPEDGAPIGTTLLIYAIRADDDGEDNLDFARELALMPGCALNHCAHGFDDDGRAVTAFEECCWRAAEAEYGYLDMVEFLCGLPGVSICTGGKGTDLPWRELFKWASNSDHYRCWEGNPFMEVVQAVARAYPNFSISNYTVEGKHPLVWACEQAPDFDPYETAILSGRKAELDELGISESLFPLVGWHLWQPGINVNQIVPGLSKDARHFKCDRGWAEPRTVLMFVMDITTTDCTLLEAVLEHPSLDLKQVCNGKTALQHWALRSKKDRERIVRIAHESDCKAVLAFHASAEQLLRGHGEGSAAGVAAAPRLTGAGTAARGDTQQRGKKKRKKEG